MARTVEILLRDNVKDLGKCGDVVRVSPGYARNYLLPRRVGIEATEDNKKAMMRRRAVLDVEEAKQAAEIEKLVAALQGIEVSTTARADDHGHLFGSVNAAAIVELLAAQGHAFTEKAVRLENPIKEVGVHPVRLHVHGDQFVEIKVTVEKAVAV